MCKHLIEIFYRTCAFFQPKTINTADKTLKEMKAKKTISVVMPQKQTGAVVQDYLDLIGSPCFRPILKP